MPTGGDVVALPSHVDQARHEVLGGAVCSGQEYPVDRVEYVVVGRPVREQTRGRLLTRGDQVGAQTPGRDRGCGLVTDGSDLETGEGTCVEAVLLEILADRLERVDRGERDPLIASLDPEIGIATCRERVCQSG